MRVNSREVSGTQALAGKASAGAGELEEQHELQAGVELVLREKGADELEDGHDPLGEAKGFELAGISAAL